MTARIITHLIIVLPSFGFEQILSSQRFAQHDLLLPVGACKTETGFRQIVTDSSNMRLDASGRQVVVSNSTLAHCDVG